MNKKDSQQTSNKSETILEKCSSRRECQNCGQTYAHRKSLWRHKQKCEVLRNKEDNERDATGLDEEGSQQTSNKLETILEKCSSSRLGCQDCDKTMRSDNMWRH